ncbi:unnamed protein product [Effrenium voratum]|nr:unnamed protein product [Effrenium voratum]|mmetsp:Transcript_125271/g.297311  ORF Transcript_125271/g.297311 Transcript_125271/m.297311 type:complete len:307 (-) Transcript_125271:21-941(-)
MGGSSSRERGSTQEAMPSPAQGTPEDEARRRQEKEDEAFARQLWMEEMSTSFGLPGASESSSSSRLSPQGVLLRASCPACGFANQFSPALGAHGQMRVQCSQCSEQFQAALPEGEHPVRARPALQLCRRCGTLNSSFPPPVPGQQVRCGRCGHVSEAEPRERHRRPVDRPQRALLEALLSEQPQALRGMSGPVVRIPIDGQRQAIPLALLAALMAAAEADKSNPARRSDVAALPTRKLANLDHLGEQTKCLICLEEFADGDELKTLPCLHFYHQKCVEQWLDTDNSCPVCKTPIGQEARTGEVPES